MCFYNLSRTCFSRVVQGISRETLLCLTNLKGELARNSYTPHIRCRRLMEVLMVASSLWVASIDARLSPDHVGLSRHGFPRVGGPITCSLLRPIYFQCLQKTKN